MWVSCGGGHEVTVLRQYVPSLCPSPRHVWSNKREKRRKQKREKTFWSSARHGREVGNRVAAGIFTAGSNSAPAAISKLPAAAPSSLPPRNFPTLTELRNPRWCLFHIPATSDGASISIIIPFDQQNVRESLLVRYSSRFQDMPRGDQRS